MMGTFLNPYRFIPLPESPCVRSTPERGALTGEIVCELVPVTALFVPEPGEESAFCTRGGTSPVIPGSSLRGMLRRLYEAFTGSCLPVLETEPEPVRGLAPKKPGLLRRRGDGYALSPALLYEFKERTELPDGAAVWFRYEKEGARFLVTQTSPAYTEVCKTQGYASGRYLFVQKKGQTLLLSGDAAVPETHGITPVWYGDEGGVLRVGTSPMGKEFQKHAPADYVQSYAPCTDAEQLCPACALFGAQGLTASRVRVGDAVFCGEQPDFAEPAELHIPGGARVTSMEVYTRLNTGDGTWSYDARRDADGLRPLSPEELTVSGRRMYVHQPDCTEAPAPHMGGRTVHIRPLRGSEANRFRFSVYFEDVTEEELRRLTAVLSLLGNDSPYCGKLGAGRPFGLGSVKTSVVSVRVRRLDDLQWSLREAEELADCYAGILPEETVFALFPDAKTVQALRETLDLHFVTGLQERGLLTDDPPVHYPAGFDWFREMRRTGQLSPFDGTPLEDV